jgi:hypothetical protein
MILNGTLTREDEENVFYYDGSLKGLSAPNSLAKMLICKVLSTAAAGTKHVYPSVSPAGTLRVKKI